MCVLRRVIDFKVSYNPMYFALRSTLCNFRAGEEAHKIIWLGNGLSAIAH